ncbi:Fur family transcriptional regulator [soil metagenome]
MRGSTGRVQGVRTPDELTDRFRSQGLKVTPQRQAIFRILHGSHVHPTAESVHAEVRRDMPTVSLRTVYQTLNDLTAMGEISQIDVGLGSSRFDPNLAPHHHLVCDGCGRVDDVAVDQPEIVMPAGSSSGFELRRTEIVFRGRCASCVAADGTPRSTTTTTKEA